MGRTRTPKEDRSEEQTVISDDSDQLIDAAHAATDDNFDNPLSEPSDEIMSDLFPAARTRKKNAVVNVPLAVVKKLKFIALSRGVSIGQALQDLIGDRIDAAYQDVFESPDL